MSYIKSNRKMTNLEKEKFKRSPKPMPPFN